MAYRRMAGSCSNGPCPTLYRDSTTRRWLVQGWMLDTAPPREIGTVPFGEAVVMIEPDEARRLITDYVRTVLADAWRKISRR